MGADSKIEWTDHTFNPWWGCEKVSAGCHHCYAEAFAKRTGKAVWGATSERRYFGDKHWAEPLKWNEQARKAGVRRRVFCASMADVFEDYRRGGLDGQRHRLWNLILATPNLDWLLLTKRPQNVARMLPEAWLLKPQPNVWLGTSVEDQATADERIHHLLATPAAIWFVSYEPALGPVDFDQCGATPCAGEGRVDGVIGNDVGSRGVDWIIVGGESGPGARPFDVAWARSTVRQCRESDAACFVKQMGAFTVSNGVVRPGEQWMRSTKLEQVAVGDTVMFRHRMADPKGGSMVEWPEDLRVRQLPKVRS